MDACCLVERVRGIATCLQPVGKIRRNLIGGLLTNLTVSLGHGFHTADTTTRTTTRPAKVADAGKVRRIRTVLRTLANQTAKRQCATDRLLCREPTKKVRELGRPGGGIHRRLVSLLAALRRQRSALVVQERIGPADIPRPRHQTNRIGIERIRIARPERGIEPCPTGNPERSRASPNRTGRAKPHYGVVGLIDAVQTRSKRRASGGSKLSVQRHRRVHERTCLRIAEVIHPIVET